MRYPTSIYASNAAYCVQCNREYRAALRTLNRECRAASSPHVVEAAEMRVEDAWHTRHHARWVLVNTEDYLEAGYREEVEEGRIDGECAARYEDIPHHDEIN